MHVKLSTQHDFRKRKKKRVMTLVCVYSQSRQPKTPPHNAPKHISTKTDQKTEAYCTAVQYDGLENTHNCGL